MIIAAPEADKSFGRNYKVFILLFEFTETSIHQLFILLNVLRLNIIPRQWEFN